MTSKLGIHNNTVTNQDALRDFILTARPKIMKTLHHDAGFWGEIKAEYPELLLIGRKYVENQRFDNPVDNAERMVRRILDTSTARVCDAWEGYNEALGGHGWDEPTKDYLLFDDAYMTGLHREGLKGVAGDWSVGCPSDLGVWTWRYMLAVVNQADYIGLHEYLAWLMWHQNGFDPHYVDRESYIETGWFTLRYRLVRGILEEMLNQGQIDRIPDFIITECGIDGGAWKWGDPSHQGGWREANITAGDYMDQLAWYDRQLRMDDYVVGATVYCGQVMDMANWGSFRLGAEMMPLLSDHITSSRPTVDIDSTEFQGWLADTAQGQVIPYNAAAFFRAVQQQAGWDEALSDEFYPKPGVVAQVFLTRADAMQHIVYAEVGKWDQYRVIDRPN